jgi:hypothetical protein
LIKRMKKIIIILVIFLFLLLILKQTDFIRTIVSKVTDGPSYKGKRELNLVGISSPIYYISSDGDDRNTGLSPDQPWKTIAQVNTSTLSPGAIVKLKRGDEWRESLIIDESGKSDAMITFSAYGTGAKPIINGANIVKGWSNNGNNVWSADCPRVKEYYGIQFNYIAIMNGEMLFQVGTLVSLNADGKYFIDSSHHKIYIYSTTDLNAKKVEVSARLFGVCVSDRIYIKLQNLDFRNAAYSGAYFCTKTKTGQLQGHSIVDSCNFYRNRIVGIIFDNGYSNSIVQHCTSTYNGNGYYSWSDQTYGSDSIAFSHCYSANNILYKVGIITDGHGFGIYNSNDNIVEYCETDGDAYGINIDPHNRKNNIIIRYNYVHNTQVETPGINIGGNTPAGTLHEVYYNLVVNTGAGSDGYAIWVQGKSRGGTAYVYNNTIYQDGGGSHNTFGIFASSSNDLLIKNNIVYSAGSDPVAVLVLYFSGLSGTSISNNIYFTPNGTSPIFYYNGTSSPTIEGWQTLTGKELNSLKSNPLFIKLGSDFTLQDGSPCINAGVNLGFKHDIIGNPIIGLPDIGCYEKQ